MKLKFLFTLLIATSISAFPVLAKNDKGYKGESSGKSIPKGLQKKVARGKSLPPGWEKKLARGEILDINIYNAGKIIVPVNGKGIVTIKVENKAIKLIKATMEIVEILE